MRYNGTKSKIKAAAAVIAGLAAQYDSPTDSALLAAALIELGWPPARARETTGAKNAYLHTVRHLGPAEFSAVEAGAAKLSTFHNSRSNGNGAAL